jgi:PAS domain S-box-containing protein
MHDKANVLDELPQPAWRCDEFGQTVECNRHWYEYTGQTPEEAYGLGWMNAVHPDDLPRVAEEMLKAAESGSYQAKYRLRRASDGSYHWHLAQAIPVPGKDGRPIGWLGSAIAI